MMGTSIPILHSALNTTDRTLPKYAYRSPLHSFIVPGTRQIWQNYYYTCPLLTACANVCAGATTTTHSNKQHVLVSTGARWRNYRFKTFESFQWFHMPKFHHHSWLWTREFGQCSGQGCSISGCLLRPLQLFLLLVDLSPQAYTFGQGVPSCAIPRLFTS